MKRGEAAPFLAGAWAGAAPLLLWALHFAANYIAVAMVCTRAVQSAEAAPDGLRWWLLAGTALALAVLSAMAWRAKPAGRNGDFLRSLRFICIVLAWVGVAWSGVPLVMLPACAS